MSSRSPSGSCEIVIRWSLPRFAVCWWDRWDRGGDVLSHLGRGVFAGQGRVVGQRDRWDSSWPVSGGGVGWCGVLAVSDLDEVAVLGHPGAGAAGQAGVEAGGVGDLFG